MTFVWCWVLANRPLEESGAWHPHKNIWTDVILFLQLLLLCIINHYCILRI